MAIYAGLFDSALDSKQTSFDIANKQFDLPLREHHQYFPYYKWYCGLAWCSEIPILLQMINFKISPFIGETVSLLETY